MTAAELVRLHDQLAAERDTAPWPPRGERDRVRIGRAIALLRTLRPVPPLPSVRNMPKLPKAKTDTPIRDAIIEALAHVTHFRHRETGEIVSYEQLHLHDVQDLDSVGLPYVECVNRVRKKIKGCQVTVAHLRWAVLSAKKNAPGYAGVMLADTRPHGMTGKKR